MEERKVFGEEANFFAGAVPRGNIAEILEESGDQVFVDGATEGVPNRRESNRGDEAKCEDGGVFDEGGELFGLCKFGGDEPKKKNSANVKDSWKLEESGGGEKETGQKDVFGRGLFNKENVEGAKSRKDHEKFSVCYLAFEEGDGC